MLSSIPRCTVIIFKKRRLVGWKIIGPKRKDAGIQLGNTLVVGGKAIKVRRIRINGYKVGTEELEITLQFHRKPESNGFRKKREYNRIQ